jgi:glycosyltransferase involved in cell wall biosynthesis
MKVALIVLNNFINDSRVYKEASTLSKEGYECTVVALHKDGLKKNESNENFTVHRLELKLKELGKNKIIQLLKYIELLILIIKHYRKFDIIHCNDLDSLPLGVILKILFNRRLRLIYDAHEYEIERNGLSTVEKKISKIIEKFLIRYVDKTITVSNSIANEYVRLYNIEKPTVILNCPKYKEVTGNNIFREKFNLSNDSIIFLYQGGLEKGRGVEKLIQVFSELENSNKVIVFMGYGSLLSVVERATKNYINIFLHSAVSPNDLLNYTNSADIGVSFIEDICLSYHFCLPNKMFEYIVADIPIMVSNLPEMRKVVVENNIGIVIDDDQSSIINSINALTKKDIEFYKSNISSIKRDFCWETQERLLLELYK